MNISTLHWTPLGGWSPASPGHDTSVELVLYFGATLQLERSDSPVRDLLTAYPAAVCAGCSTAGEIFGATVSDGGLTVALVSFSGTQVRGALEAIAQPADSEAVGAALGRALRADDLRHVLVLSDGLGVNGSALTAGLREVLPPEVFVTGGLAGDGAHFRRTVVGLGGDIGPRRVVALGFYGDRIRAAWGSAGGWVPFGPKRLITRAEGNVLYSLDDQPALALYKRYLGDRAAGLPSAGLLFPLEVLTSREAQSGVVRTILAVDEEKQSVTFAGNMPQGQYARLMKAGGDALVAGADHAATRAQAAFTGPQLAVLVSCVGRKLVLGPRVEDEIEAVLSRLPDDAGVVGFYSYGEICPSGLAPGCDLHNQTMTLTVLGEVP